MRLRPPRATPHDAQETMTSERRVTARPRSGRARIPGSHGAGAVSRWAPGLLAALALTAAAGAAAPPPALGASPLGWSLPALIDHSGAPPNAIACPSESLCVAVAGAASWSHAVIDPEATRPGVACPSPSLCVAVDDQGRALTTGSPGSPGAGWSASKIDAPANRLQAVSCSGPSSCVAVDGAGGAFGSESPAAGGWHARAVDPGLALSAVSCSPGGACVAVDAGGDALASADPSSLGAT